MIKIKEILWIIFFSILLGALLKLRSPISDLPVLIPLSILSLFVVISINIIAKKLTARYLDSSIEVSPWSFKRFGLASKKYFKKPFPSGILFPIISTIASLGYFIWLAVFEFEPSPLSSRVTKRHGMYRFSELTEWHIGIIAASGVVLNLLFAIIFYLLPFNLIEIAKLSIFFAVWNMVPLGNLDGSKILFGSRLLWYSLALISLIFLLYALLLV